MVLIHDIDPIALALPFWPYGVHWYGLMYLAAFAAAYRMGLRRLAAGRLPGVDQTAFGDLMFYAMMGVVLGGRVGYVLFYNLSELARDPLLLFRIHQGGMSFHGGLLGVVFAVAWWSRARKQHIFDSIEFIVPLVPLGLGFGRIGNFIGGELWGRITDLPWAMIFPRALPAQFAGLDMLELRRLAESGALEGLSRHPSQLYQAVLEGVVLFGLVWWFTRKPRPRYAVSGLFALLYGMFRFAVEFVREPDAHLGFIAFEWLSMGQLLSLPLIALGSYWLWIARRAPVLAASN